MMKDAFVGWCPRVMIVNRALGIAGLLGLTVYSSISISWKTMLFFTNWGIFISLLTFISILLRNKHAFIGKSAEMLLPTVWLMNVIITLFFWVVLFPLLMSNVANSMMLPQHTFPIIFISIELSLNGLAMTRKAGFYATGITLLYLMLILLPYTLFVDIVYPDFSFRNLFSYLSMIGILVAYVLVTELGVCVKAKILNSRYSSYERLIQLEPPFNHF